MSISKIHHPDFFFWLFGAIATITPISLVIAAATFPEGLARGDFFVNSHGMLLLSLVAIAGLRISYVLGIKDAARQLDHVRTQL